MIWLMIWVGMMVKKQLDGQVIIIKDGFVMIDNVSLGVSLGGYRRWGPPVTVNLLVQLVPKRSPTQKAMAGFVQRPGVRVHHDEGSPRKVL